MPDVRSMKDSKWLKHFHLPVGRDFVLTITKVERVELNNPMQNSKEGRPGLFFRETEKILALNATNMKAIAAIYGWEANDWAGKPIAVYRTTTQMAGQTVECIRVRNKAPKVKAQLEPIDEPAHDPETGVIVDGEKGAAE